MTKIKMKKVMPYVAGAAGAGLLIASACLVKKKVSAKKKKANQKKLEADMVNEYQTNHSNCKVVKDIEVENEVVEEQPKRKYIKLR